MYVFLDMIPQIFSYPSRVNLKVKSRLLLILNINYENLVSVENKRVF